MANTPRSDEKLPGEDPRWDRKQGTPKDPKAAQTVERASGRYSASEQSEEKLERKRSGKSQAQT
jgi:hypothetical protein